MRPAVGWLFVFFLVFFLFFLVVAVFLGFFFVFLFVFVFVFGVFLFFFLFWFAEGAFDFHFCDEAVDDVHLCLAVLAHHLGVDAHAAGDGWAVVFAEHFLELVDVVKGVAVDAEALVEASDAQVLFGEGVVGQRAEEFEEVAAGFAEGAQAFNGLEIGEVGVEDCFFDEMVAAGKLFASELFKRRGLCGGHEGSDGLVQCFVVVFFAVFTAEVVTEGHDGAVLFNDHGIGQWKELEFAGVVNSFEDGVDAAQFFEVVVKGQVELFCLVERFEFAVWSDELQQCVLAAQCNAQLAEGFAVVWIGEEGVAGFDDPFVLIVDEGADADTERYAEEIQVLHLIEIDAVDADGLLWLCWWQIEHFAAAFFEVHIEAGHFSHPVAEVGFVADDDDGFAVVVAGDGFSECLEVAFFEKWLNLRCYVWHVAAEHFGCLERACFWRGPDFAMVFGVEITCQRWVGVFQPFFAGHC